MINSTILSPLAEQETSVTLDEINVLCVTGGVHKQCDDVINMAILTAQEVALPLDMVLNGIALTAFCHGFALGRKYESSAMLDVWLKESESKCT